MLIHSNYLSQKDINICLAAVQSLADCLAIEEIRAPHGTLARVILVATAIALVAITAIVILLR